MYDILLDLSESTLLKTLADLQAAQGSVPRDALSVATRGRGVEFGRSYARIKSFGLIAEVTRRPFWLRRLLGAPSVLTVQLTEAGRMVLAEMAAPLAPNQQSVAPLQALEPAPPAPDALQHLAAPIPVIAAPQKAPSQPKKRRAVVGFTEDLGGTPLQPEPVAAAHGDHAPAIEALREVLAGLGIDLTMAGEMLASHRMDQGYGGAEALMQVIVFTFAHAVHQDLTNGRETAAMGLAEYAVEVQRELQKLRDAGAIPAARFDADMGQLVVLMSATADAARLAETLLQDPFGGAAPPALLPEELRTSDSRDDADDDSF